MIIKRQIVPNFFTGMNFILGLCVILIVTGSQTDSFVVSWVTKSPFMLGAWMILWSVNMDKMDGLTARLMNASSDFGAEFDSLADLLTFGISPAMLVFYYTKSINPLWFNNHKVLMFVALVVYAIFTAMRLARFNSDPCTKLNRSFFTGLPSTVAGGLVALVVILFDQYELYKMGSSAMSILPSLLIACGLAMVSPFLLPKLARRKRVVLNFMQTILVVFGYIFSFGMLFPEYLFTIIVMYTIGGFLYSFINRSKIDEEFLES